MIEALTKLCQEHREALEGADEAEEKEPEAEPEE